MKKVIVLFSSLIILISLSSFISSDYIIGSKMNIQDYKLMLGEFSLKELKSTVNKTWFTSEYKNYTPKQDVVKKIKSVIKNEKFHISVYMGTWCPDSRREFPHLIKILNQSDFNLKNLTIIGVDRDKVVPNISKEESEKLNILNVPTIIVYNAEGKEINRFVEFPQETLEEDLLKILSGEDYKHVYDF